MKHFSLAFLALVIFSCNWAKEKTKQTVNKSGEVIAKTGSEFVDGVSKGVEKTFQNEISVSDELARNGLRTGKIIINDSDSARNNVLTAYLIFDKGLNKEITVKIFDEDNQEYGRVSQKIQAPKGEAKYVDFGFEKRVNIESKGKIVFE